MTAKTLCTTCRNAQKLSNFDNKGKPTPKVGYHCSRYGKRIRKSITVCEGYIEGSRY